ncbi:MAG: GntR family transcriptional regulator [Lachnospira sp.]
MISVDLMSRVPVYEQIVKQVENQILFGTIRPGDKMPSVRGLSVSLSVNPNTVQKAYTELDRIGITISVPGRGSFIADNALELISSNSRDKLDEMAEMIRELRMAGIAEEEIIKLVKEVYTNND